MVEAVGVGEGGVGVTLLVFGVVGGDGFGIGGGGGVASCGLCRIQLKGTDPWLLCTIFVQ